MLYRVLSKDETAFTDANTPTLFLDCDTVLTNRAFGANNTWAGSEVRTWLNGDFYNGGFTALERAAIADSARTPPGEKTSYGTQGLGPEAIDLYLYHTSLDSDKVFLLDVTEATKLTYGYSSDTGASPARVKKYNNYPSWSWLLRSPSSYGANAKYMGVVSQGGGNGSVGGGTLVSNSNNGVSPALNVRLSSVVFSSRTSKSGTYKLTLLDSGMAVTGTAAWDDDYVTVSYAVESGSPTRLSLLVTSGAWDDASGWSVGASASYYASAQISGTGGTEFFSAPGLDVSGLNVYILAETVNGEKETDYASAPVLVSGSGQSSGGGGGENSENSDMSGGLSLGTNKIANPDGTNGGGWSYVYYGFYDDGEVGPMRYRVLDRKTSNFGGTSMLLDCDAIIWTLAFKSGNTSNLWAGSDVRAWLNGDDFLNKNGVFTAQERAAIASSTKAGKANGEEDVTVDYHTFGYAALNNDKVFLLDAVEATRPSYGYPKNASNSAARVKSGCNGFWWLRSPFEYDAGSQGDKYKAGSVNNEGGVRYNRMNDDYVGVSPAFNVALPSVLFASVITGKAGQPGAEYRLTLLDTGGDRLTVTSAAAALNGAEATVTYALSGTYADDARVSVLMTGGEDTWTESAGWSEGAEAEYYAPLAGTDGTSGTFTLPEKYDPSWKTYIVAEKTANSKYRTGYASAPRPVDIPYVEVEGVSLDRTSANVGIGQTVTLSADVRPAGATIRTVTWTSSNRAVATVNRDGVVTGRSAGTAVITATSNACNALSAACAVTVRGGSESPAPGNGGDSGGSGNPGGKDTRPEPRPGEITLDDGTTIPYAGIETPDAATAEAVRGNLTELLRGLPADVPFFMGLGNAEFPDIGELLSFIGEINETLRDSILQITAVMPPVRVSVPGVYLMKVTLSDEQQEELKGSKNLTYHVAPCEDKGNAQIAEDDAQEALVPGQVHGGAAFATAGAESSDGSRGVLVNANGEELSGEYDGASELHALAYFARADVTYVQYLTAEAEAERGETAASAHSGCEVAGLGLIALAAVLPALLGRGRR